MSDSEQRRPDDGVGTPIDKPVAGISVLKRDKLKDNLASDMRPNKMSTSINNRNDSYANAIDISDIENSFNDVSRSIRFTRRQHNLLCTAMY